MADKNDRDQPNRRAHPVLEYYTWRFTDQLTPKEKQILAAMSDDLYKLVRAAFEMAQDQLSPPDGLLPGYEDHSVFRARVRRNEPALESLSDQELDVALDAVRRLGSDGHAVEKFLAKTGEYVPVDTDVLRRAYAAVVNGLAWTFLYYKFGKTPATTPLRELFSADELELTGADPATPVGDVLPREALVQACRDACARAADLLDILDYRDLLNIRFADLRPKPAVENVVARYLEILRDTITPSRPGRWEDFSEGKLELPSGAEIRRFLFPPGNKDIAPLTSDNLKSGWKQEGYDDLDDRENRNFKLIHQLHWGWCDPAPNS
jgi:hypothetical protein